MDLKKTRISTTLTSFLRICQPTFVRTLNGLCHRVYVYKENGADFSFRSTFLVDIPENQTDQFVTFARGDLFFVVRHLYVFIVDVGGVYTVHMCGAMAFCSTSLWAFVSR